MGRKSHTDARLIFALHVVGVWPKVAKLPAHTFTSEQVADTMRSPIEMGKGRTANILRSHVRAHLRPKFESLLTSGSLSSYNPVAPPVFC